jgi:hypothetical protein
MFQAAAGPTSDISHVYKSNTLRFAVALSVFRTTKEPFWDKLCLADYIRLVERNICNKLMLSFQDTDWLFVFSLLRRY